MGQTMTTMIIYINEMCQKLGERAKSMFPGSEKRESKYFKNAFIPTDEEQHADILSSEEINKIIKRQQNLKKHTPSDINLNEYKMIKNTMEMEEAESLTDKPTESNDTVISKEIEDLQKEVINLQVDDDVEKEEAGEEMENIEDLKASILNHD